MGCPKAFTRKITPGHLPIRVDGPSCRAHNVLIKPAKRFGLQFPNISVLFSEGLLLLQKALLQAAHMCTLQALKPSSCSVCVTRLCASTSLAATGIYSTCTYTYRC